MLLERRAVIDACGYLSRTPFTGQQSTGELKSCAYYWSVAQMPMCATNMVTPPAQLQSRRGHQEIVELVSECGVVSV
jgi:hypothetical protein